MNPIKVESLNDGRDSDHEFSEMQDHQISHDESSPTPPWVVVLATVLASILLGLCCYWVVRL